MGYLLKTINFSKIGTRISRYPREGGDPDWWQAWLTTFTPHPDLHLRGNDGYLPALRFNDSVKFLLSLPKFAARALRFSPQRCLCLVPP